MDITAETWRSFLGGQAVTKELKRLGDAKSGIVIQLGQILSLDPVKSKRSGYDQIKITFTWRASLENGEWVENSNLELIRDLGWFPEITVADQVLTFSSPWEEIRLIPTNHQTLTDYAPVIKKPSDLEEKEKPPTKPQFSVFEKLISAL